MRWVVAILAVVTLMVSAGSLYFAYMAGLPAAGQVEVHSGSSGANGRVGG